MIVIQLNKEKSQVLIETLYQIQETALSCDVVLHYLSKTMEDNKDLFLRESLRAALLQDLHKEFAFQQQITEEPANKTWLHWFKWALLALSGTVYAACDGFDGITTILALFPNVPLSIIFAAGFVFALLSVCVFYGFYLVDISDEAHLGLKEQNRLIDIRLEQLHAIDELLLASQIIVKRSQDLDELKTLRTMLPILNQMYLNLQAEKNNYESQLKNVYLVLTKKIVSIFLGILFFGYGFFGGQSLALTLVPLFTVATIIPFGPVMAVSFLIGLAALSVYWLVERPSLEKLVGRCFGLDENKIEKLPNPARTKYQTMVLNEMLTDLNQRVATIESCFVSQTINTPTTMSSDTDSCHQTIGFFSPKNKINRSLSMNDLNKEQNTTHLVFV